MTFRQAQLTDLNQILTIIDAAVARMLREGKQQWDETYPAMSDILRDLTLQQGYVLTSGRKILAYGAVVFSGEPAYDDLDGEWLSDSPYVVVHRLAVAQEEQQRGVGGLFLRSVENMAAANGIGSFRIDTNFDNNAMLRLLEKEGFEYCGDIRYDRGSRRAFEKLI